MYYLSNFNKNQTTQPNFIQSTLNKGVSSGAKAVKNIPFFKEQTTDFLKQKGLNFAQQQASKKKLSLKQKVRLGKGYLKYRKHLGDTYGKEKGMGILNKQTNYLKNLVNPSYKQIPID